MKAKVVKWGNCLAVRIPRLVAQDAHLREGDTIELSASSEGKVEVRRVLETPTLEELVAGITPENRHGEISPGHSVGKEIVEW